MSLLGATIVLFFPMPLESGRTLPSTWTLKEKVSLAPDGAPPFLAKAMVGL